MVFYRLSVVAAAAFFLLSLSIAFVCLFDSRIAAAPIATMTIANTTSAMLSESQPPDQTSTIESAITSNNRIFLIYVVVLVGGAIVGAILTVMLFKSGNRVQEAIKADADARLKSSEERIAVLTGEAERARAGITKGQADAAQAIERTRTLELEIAKQRERAAKAETELLALQERLKPRHLTVEQLARLLPDLSRGEKGEIEIDFVSGNLEAQNFATEIAKALQATGWTVKTIGSMVFLGEPQVGVRMIVHDPQTPRVLSLVSAFEQIGISVPVKVNPKASHPVLLIVGHKP